MYETKGEGREGGRELAFKRQLILKLLPEKSMNDYLKRPKKQTLVKIFTRKPLY